MDIKQHVIDNFGDNALRKSAISLRDGADIFKHFLDGKGYKTVLEIGTYRGVSAAEIAKYCDKVITIDLQQGQLERTDVEFSRDKLWESLNLTDKIELHLVRDDAEKIQLVNNISFDFAFVDGDHGNGVNLDWELVKRCKNVLFHDYDTSGRPALSYVYNLVKRLPQDEVEIVDIFAFWKSK